MDDVLTKVHKLIGLTDSPFEEEARTAALKAVKLIRENKLLPSPEPSIESKRQAALAGLVATYLDGVIFKLQKQAKSAVYMFVTAKSVAAEITASCEVRPEFQNILLSCVKRQLRDRVSVRELEFKPGKGYRVPYSMVWDIVA